MVYLFFGVYLLAMLGILFYCLLQLSLAVIYLQQKRKSGPSILANPEDDRLPHVTVQLPLYNEYFVVKRLLNAVTALRYPKEKLEIQILDDSTDDTTGLIQQLMPALQKQGFNIDHKHRTDRKGYKAGALAEGLPEAKGDFIAIFDADFIPHPDFLLHTIPHFEDPKVGVVQTRWQHINKNYSLLTRIQAFALDVHFSIEQTGRNQKGYFINFNGTAGVWRRATIIDAGGWSADTLTEDLDLSYRAQMKGWQFRYLEHVGSPAELPAAMQGYKSQQFRWNKGGAETAKKIIPSLLHTKVPFRTKLHGVAHLLNSSVYLCIWISILLSVPLLWIMDQYFSQEIYNYLSIFLLATFATAVVFFVAMFSSVQHRNRFYQFLHYLLLFPAFLTINIGMSFHNALAVIRGYIGERTPFVRTPKFNIGSKGGQYKKHKYLSAKINWTTLVEGLFALYFAGGVWLAFHFENYGMLPIHLMATIGFTIIFYRSIQEVVYAPGQ